MKIGNVITQQDSFSRRISTGRHVGPKKKSVNTAVVTFSRKQATMKIAVVLASTLAVASAFAPAPVTSRTGTELMAKKGGDKEKKPFFNSVFGMDLFAPNPTVNTYGARSKKNVSDLD